MDGMKTVGIRIGFPTPHPGLGFVGSLPSVPLRSTLGYDPTPLRGSNYAALAGSSDRSLAQIASISEGGFIGSLAIRTPTAA